MLLKYILYPKYIFEEQTNTYFFSKTGTHKNNLIIILVSSA